MTLFDVHAHFYPPIFTQTDIENCNVKVLAVAENLNDCKQVLLDLFIDIIIKD